MVHVYQSVSPTVIPPSDSIEPVKDNDAVCGEDATEGTPSQGEPDGIEDAAISKVMKDGHVTTLLPHL